MTICKVENISKYYKKNLILDNISINIDTGDYILIKGESGAGKSTFLNIISGISKPNNGKVYINCTDIYSAEEKELTLLRKNKLGLIYQNAINIEALTVKENLLFINNNLMKNSNNNKVDYIIEELGLAHIKNNLPYQLSGGEKRRLMIASTLIKEPKLILADEPTNDLDKYWRDKVLNLLYEQTKKGSAVLLITHLDENISYINKKFKLKKGKLIEYS